MANKWQTMIYTKLLRKLNIEEHEPTKKPGVNSCAQEE